MKKDLFRAVEVIAQFIGCQPDPELVELVVKQASIDFMRTHQEKFDDPTTLRAVAQLLGNPPPKRFEKVRKGLIGQNAKELPDEISAEIDMIWREEIEPKFGLASYEILTKILA